MQFVAPVKFTDAIEKLGAKSPIGAALSSKEWSAVPVALRERAMFSAQVESIRFLSDLKQGMVDFLEGARDPETGALKVGSRAAFIQQMRRKAIADGLGPIDPKDSGTIRDVRSERRLALIFDVNVTAAREYGSYKQGLDGDVLNEFPAQQFIRVMDVQSPRDRHRPFEDQIFLKTDTKAWLRINQDFGVPWGPWGWGCGHSVQDIGRDTTDALGLTQPGQRIEGNAADFNENLKASVRDLEPEHIEFLKTSFGDQLEISDGVAKWVPQRPIDTDTSALPTTPAAPAPTPVTDPEPRAWKSELESIATIYKTAKPAQKDALIAQAHKAIEVTEDLRRGVVLENKASRAVAQIAQVGNDLLARFVRPSLTQGVKVSVHQTSDSREFYRAGGVYLNSRTDRSTALHELGHAVEQAHPSVLQAAAQFLLRRANGGAPEKLSKLTGNPRYFSTERAYEDQWLARGGRVYIGKLYSAEANPVRADQIRATEIISMSLERLLLNPVEFLLNDPELFNWVIETIGIGPSIDAAALPIKSTQSEEPLQLRWTGLVMELPKPAPLNLR